MKRGLLSGLVIEPYAKSSLSSMATRSSRQAQLPFRRLGFLYFHSKEVRTCRVSIGTSSYVSATFQSVHVLVSNSSMIVVHVQSFLKTQSTRSDQSEYLPLSPAGRGVMLRLFRAQSREGVILMNLSYKVEEASIHQLMTLAMRETSPAINEVLANYNSLKKLVSATKEELMAIKGIGPAKANRILAILELARRMSMPNDEEKVTIRSPRDLANILTPMLRFEDKEHFVAVLTNTKNQILDIKTISLGTLNASLVHPRELFKSAIKASAAAIFVGHNHPSGDPEPSKEDIALTRRLCQAGEILGIELMDHLIVADGRFCSLKERGLM